MRAVALRALVLEAKSTVRTVRRELSSTGGGSVVVSGMLAEQLAKELGLGAEPGAVRVTEREDLAGAEAAVRIIAGDPNEEDVAVVRAADRAEIPVVLVQLWPQADWRGPYVLSPFVVECRTGEGFPVGTIASLIALAVEHPTGLAARIPVLREPVVTSIERGALVRSTLLGVLGAKSGGLRPLLALEQVRMLAQLLSLEPPERRPEEAQLAAGLSAVTLAASFGLRSLGRTAPRQASGAAGRRARRLRRDVGARGGRAPDRRREPRADAVRRASEAEQRPSRRPASPAGRLSAAISQPEAEEGGSRGKHGFPRAKGGGTWGNHGFPHAKNARS